jgi:YidC/Oxa1 family membrane protein insertase
MLFGNDPIKRMNIFIYFYQVVFSRPILNVLVYFYQTIAFHDLGLSIIFVTLLIRLVLYPFFHSGAKQQMVMQRLQPKIKKLQEEHKDNKEKQAQALMDLYKEHGVNPLSGILLLVIQLPILIALYRIILSGLGASELSGLYSFVANPHTINSTLLGVVNLQARSLFLVVLAGIAQYFQARLAIWRNPAGDGGLSPAEKMARQMAFIAPVFTVVIFYNLPAAVGLYWLASSIFSIIQQLIVNKHIREKYGG